MNSDAATPSAVTAPHLMDDFMLPFVRCAFLPAPTARIGRDAVRKTVVALENPVPADCVIRNEV
jgi:hypothetical protein